MKVFTLQDNSHEAIIDPELFDYVQEMRRDRNEDPRGFSGMNPWNNRMVCGKCGNYFRNKHRHYRACWECRDSYRKDNPCKNTFIMDGREGSIGKSDQGVI